MDGKKIWDRRDIETTGFPEAKVLKQLVRDEISPDMSLGHSDGHSNGHESKVTELSSE